MTHSHDDRDPTDYGRLSEADELAVLARRGIGPATPSRGGGLHRVRTRMAQQHQRHADDNDETKDVDVAGHVARIRAQMGWAQPSAEERAKRQRPCPACGAAKFSACTKLPGGRGPTVPAHTARSEVGIPAQR